MTPSENHPDPSVWYCDECGELTDDIEHTYVLWRRESDDETFAPADFRIIHQIRCDRREREYGSSIDMRQFLGVDGQAYLLGMLSPGPIIMANSEGGRVPLKDFDGFVDFFRRVQTPHYEEARRHFQCEGVADHYSDASEYYPYLVETLARIIDHDGECHSR